MTQSHRVISKQSIWVTAIFVCALTAVLGAATSWRWLPLLRKKANPLCAEAKIAEFCELGLRGDLAGLRQCMKKMGPQKTWDCVTAIDGRFDRFGQARMDILKALASLKDEGLEYAARAEWSKVLANAAQTLLREGKEREEYLRIAERLAGGPPAAEDASNAAEDPNRDPAAQKPPISSSSRSPR